MIVKNSPSTISSAAYEEPFHHSQKWAGRCQRVCQCYRQFFHWFVISMIVSLCVRVGVGAWVRACVRACVHEYVCNNERFLSLSQVKSVFVWLQL